jgi:hypothetical protein
MNTVYNNYSNFSKDNKERQQATQENEKVIGSQVSEPRKITTAEHCN